MPGYTVEVVRLERPNGTGAVVPKVVRRSPPYFSPSTAEYVARITAEQLQADLTLAVRIVSGGTVLGAHIQCINGTVRDGLFAAAA